MSRYVIVGAGPASAAAATAIRAADPGALTTVVTSDPHGYYSRPGLAYWLVKEEPLRALFPFGRKDWASLGVSLVTGRAEEIDRARGVVRLADGRALPYDRLLLATGSAAIPLRVPGASLDGVVKLDDLADAQDIARRSRGAKRAVVVGGGSTAVEIAEGLLARGVRVEYFMRKDRYWSDVLSEAESRIVEDGLRRRGIRIHDHTETAEVLGRDGRVTGVSTAGGETLPCDVLAVAVGVRPQVALAERAGLACARGVLVDEHLRTSDPAILAAGDVAETLDAIGGRSMEVLWDSAVREGRAAGLAMAGSPQDEPYRPRVPLNVTRLAGHKIAIIGAVGRGRGADLEGLGRGDSEGWRAAAASTAGVEWEDDECRIRLELADDRLDGAVVMGDQELAFVAEDLVATGVPLAAVADSLRQPGADVPGILRRLHGERGERRA